MTHCPIEKRGCLFRSSRGTPALPPLKNKLQKPSIHPVVCVGRGKGQDLKAQARQAALANFTGTEEMDILGAFHSCSRIVGCADTHGIANMGSSEYDSII